MSFSSCRLPDSGSVMSIALASNVRKFVRLSPCRLPKRLLFLGGPSLASHLLRAGCHNSDVHGLGQFPCGQRLREVEKTVEAQSEFFFQILGPRFNR